MQKKYLVLLCAVFVMTGLAGCQTQSVDESSETQTDFPELAVPFTRGPSSPPSVVGPTSAPPGGADIPPVEMVTDLPQALTETEDISISIPPQVPSSTPPMAAPGE